MIESISQIEKATLESLWTDDLELFPKKGEKIWWEVWLRVEKEKDRIINFFRANALRIGLKLSDEDIRFPDRSVVLAYGSPEQITQALELLSCISELRKAKENPEFFMKMPRKEQRKWIEDALKRITPDSTDRVAICILDTGITREHPLIKSHLSEADMHSYSANWIKSDHHGHGTEMAGLALYGDDLTELLTSNIRLNIPYRLESSKILPPAGDNDPKLYGEITSQCISRAEVESPDRQRILSMAVTAPDNRDRGQPSSWSAKIDSICSGADDDNRRLLIISAGNTSELHRQNYPAQNISEGIHDPAQAWNALCVGSFTGKSFIDSREYPGWKPIAPPGDLSPSSTTSIIWDKQWPIKPDIVNEGGNNAIIPSSGEADNGPDSLRLLTTHYLPLERFFTVSGDTSAAAMQVARMAAIIQAEYPGFWPETIRALIVHSAEWTPAMLVRWEPLKDKKNLENLLRYCGFGVPDLTRALRSANNALTLIIQDKLFPYAKKENRYITRDMHLHKIPWPAEVLRGMAETDVEMRVTLSYFVESNPARRGWEKRYRYASHQLLFDVKTPTEKLEQFKKRINKAARDEDEKAGSSSDSKEWELGPKLRSKGSIHSDRWKGSAIDLAERGYIAVYPAVGWWRDSPRLERWDREARYSMIVSITTPKTDIDIYTPIANEVGIKIQV